MKKKPLLELLLGGIIIIILYLTLVNPLCANPTKWSNTLKQFDGSSRSVFDHSAGL